MHYNIFLQFFGLKTLLTLKKNTNNNRVILEIDTKFNVDKYQLKHTTKCWKTSIFRNIINIMYIILVGALISWPCIYILIDAFFNNLSIILINVFTFLPIIQYFVGLKYYNSKRFTKMMGKFDTYDKHTISSLCVATIISILISVLSIYFLVSDINLTIYSHLYNNSDAFIIKLLICILMFVTKLYSYGIILINAVMFSIIFISHSDQINEYVDKFGEYIVNNEEGMTIESIISEFSEQRTMYSKSVNRMNGIFSSLTVIGLIGGYFLSINFGTEYVGALHYISLSLFLIIELLYFYIIDRVKNNVSNIISIIDSDKFTIKFLTKTSLSYYNNDDYYNNVETLEIMNENESKYKKNHIKEMALRTMIKSHENAESINWLVLNNKLHMSWQQFNILGFEIDDSQLIQKISALVIGLFIFTNSGSTLI